MKGARNALSIFVVEIKSGSPYAILYMTNRNEDKTVQSYCPMVRP